MAALIFVMFRMAMASPPCNYDVQSYHLPRQIYWLMQGSVEHFDATYPFQNCHPVLSEFLGLNLMLLSGGDAWHNLSQWFFFTAACGVLTLMVKSIEGSPRAQALAVLFVALVPVVFFEASNAKNDIMASFFILIPLLIGLRICSKEWKVEVALLLLAALAAGLAMAAKGTAVSYLPPIALLLLVATLRAGAWRSLAVALLPGVMIVGIVILPNTIRNLHSYCSITGPSVGMTNERYDPDSVLGVCIKNVANQFAWGSDFSIHQVELVTRNLLLSLGLNPDDPYTNIGAAQLGGPNLHFFYFLGCEDVIPSPVQTGLCLLIPFFLLIPAFRKGSGTIALSCVLMGSFLLFCAIFRWQPWGGRLLIPAFFMAAPLVGKAEDLFRPKWIPILVTALMMAFLWQHISYTGQRHLLGWWSVFRMPKEEQMSVAFTGRMEEIRKVAGILKEKHATNVMVDGKDSPIYGLLREVHMELSLVRLRSGHLAAPNNADAIVEAVSGDEGVVPMGYHLDWSGKYYRVYSLIH
ncbi:MAG: glycosyltransferase family 39 protein [Verrucomicrobia bacterium]|nr:glycosyltransferase family 39 protein [Verrucomicrobiota bacterium]